MRMDAYYYCFVSTGVEKIDRILSAVACAGKAFHHTEDWTEDCAPYEPFLRGANPVEWIQNAALDAAPPLSVRDADVEAAQEIRVEIWRHLQVLDSFEKKPSDYTAFAHGQMHKKARRIFERIMLLEQFANRGRG